MVTVKAVGVCRKYGAQEVLKNLNLELETGSFEALMGPSGCGKSTFLHLVAGLLAVDAGSIEVGGREVSKMSDAEMTRFRRRHVGVVFQQFNLLNEKSVRENILMPLRLDHRRIDGTIENRLDRLVRVLGLVNRLDERPAALSGGEQQRVAIARALMIEPDVVLADEPTGNLDMQAAKDICGLLKELNATEKSAILLVTHDPVVAATARRVHFLKDGSVCATHETEGDPALVSRLYLETYR